MDPEVPGSSPEWAGANLYYEGPTGELPCSTLAKLFDVFDSSPLQPMANEYCR